MTRFFVAAGACALVTVTACLVLHGQARSEALDPAVVARIRDEALNRSQIMDTVGYLTDVVGPRLTGSPALVRAEEYARDRMSHWGMADAHLEPWGPFGRGWTLTHFAASMTAPGYSPLIAYPKAWSPPTPGVVRAEAVFLDVKTRSDFERYRGRLRGRIVLFSPERAVSAVVAPPSRQTDESLRALADAPMPRPPAPFSPSPETRAALQFEYEKWQFVTREAAALVVTPAAGDYGTANVTAAIVPAGPEVPFDARMGPWDLSKPSILPQVAVAAEQYNRMVRLVRRGVPVTMAVDIAATFIDEDPMAYNVIAEIPGTDLADQVVMVGGCIDSWHTSTGATDNAAGAATAMEAARIILALGLHPRRTIRVGLWAAEEQGRYGSRAYVAAHFAPADRGPGSEHDRFAGYFNLDYGTGRIRGIFTKRNASVRPIFQAWLASFADLGASTTSLADVGADDDSFTEAGLPGFQFIRDYMEGRDARSPHTNMDTYEHVLPDDLKQSAAVAAAFIYGLAMRDQPLPRR